MSSAQTNTDITEYLYILILKNVTGLKLPSNPVRREEMLAKLESLIVGVLTTYNANDITDMNVFTEFVFDRLVVNKVIADFNVQYAGQYFFYAGSGFAAYQSKTLQNSSINAIAELVGNRFWPDVFAGFRTAHDEQGAGLPMLGVALASNRIVNFNHNQITELDQQTTQVIEAVEKQNDIGGVAGLRELLLGQLRAGRELVRVGTVRAYLLQLTLLESLRYLASRYEKEVIGGLAATLLAALAKHLGVGG